MFFKKKEILSIDALRNAFDEQAKQFNENLEGLWKNIEEHLKKSSIIIKGQIPLLIVPSGNFRDMLNLAHGHTELDPSYFGQQSSFSVILDVEDGSKMLAKSPKDALTQFAKEKRHPLNAHESLAIVNKYPEILKHHYIIAAGTMYKKGNEELPLLWLLNEEDLPELHYAWFDIAHGAYGTASYRVKFKI